MKTLSLQSNTLKFALTGVLGAAAILSAPGQALAANPVTIPSGLNAGIYTINFVTGDYNTVKNVVTNPSNSLWWGDSNLASSLSTGLGSSNSLPGNLPMLNGSFTDDNGMSFTAAGPLFAISTGSFLGTPTITGQASSAPYSTASNFLLAQSNSTSFNWAIATKAPLPGSAVPGPLPIFGAAAAFGFSRRLRNRISKSAAV
jgi:hypothetical protein